MLASLAATTTTSPSAAVISATGEYLPEMTLVAVAAITVGAAVLGFRRGWGFFKGLSK